MGPIGRLLAATLVAASLTACQSAPTPTLAEVWSAVDANLERGAKLVREDPAGAKSAFDEALRIAPESAYVHFEIASAWLSVDPDAAIFAFSRALERESSEPHHDASPLLKFTEGFPEDTRAWLLYFRGCEFQAKGSKELALADLEEAQRLRPDPAWWSREAGMITDFGPTHGPEALIKELESEPR